MSTGEEQSEEKPSFEQGDAVAVAEPRDGHRAAEDQQIERPPVVARKPKERGWFMGALQSLAGTVVIALFVITFIVQAFQIPSESMENTLLIGDYLLVDKVHFGHGGVWGQLMPYTRIKRGDIVVFRYPVNPVQHFVKRVIGTPGDRVRLVNKQVYVNGRRVAEKYVVFRSPGFDAYRDDFPRTDYVPRQGIEAFWWQQMRDLVRGGELVVPPKQYFVMGDNRDESLDSRYWGFVPEENIIGRPLLIYWSVQSSERPLNPGNPRADTFSGLAYAVTHIFQDTRWDRTFHLVK